MDDLRVERQLAFFEDPISSSES